MIARLPSSLLRGTQAQIILTTAGLPKTKPFLMQFSALDIADVKLFTPRQFSDARGYFMETFKLSDFCKAIEQDIVFVQDNQSFSEQAYTVRGLHYQSPPHAQGKLVRCTQGKILDVAVDARDGSPTYGQYVSAVLSAENRAQLWIPAGFLHGFVTLSPQTEVHYKCTNYYAADCDGNVLWNDPDLGIDWGFEHSQAVLSDKDGCAPNFASFKTPFPAL